MYLWVDSGLDLIAKSDNPIAVLSCLLKVNTPLVMFGHSPRPALGAGLLVLCHLPVLQTILAHGFLHKLLMSINMD
jgi:hypothetical protein